MHSPSPDDEPLDRAFLEDLLTQALERAESEGPNATDELVAAHPRYASALRERLALLSRMRLFDDATSFDTSLLPDDLHVIRHLGRGGMADVYLADQPSRSRQVAVKLFARGPLLSSTQLERLRREARALAAVDHPHVVRVHEMREHAGQFMLLMDYVPGRTLEETSRGWDAAERRQSLRCVTRWGRDLADALASAHEHGLIHRDIKPSNVLVRPDGHIVLLDFGLARHLDEESLSATGAFIGSPNYAAPEQVRAIQEEIGAPTDIYGLGLTLYECVTGWSPFPGTTTEQVFHQVLHHVPRPLRRHAPWARRDLETVLTRCVEKRPRHRYQSMEALRADLSALLEERPISVRRPTPLTRTVRWAQREPSRAVAWSLALITLGASAALASQWPELRQARAAHHAEAIETELEQAFVDLSFRNLFEARRRFEWILEQAPEHDEALCGLIWSHLEEGDLEASSQRLARRPPRDGESVALRALRVDVLDPDRAADSLRRMASDAHTPLDHYSLGHMETICSSTDVARQDALRHYRNAVRFADRPRALYYNGLVTAAVHAGDLTTAHDEFEVMRRRWPDNPLTLACLGVLHLIDSPERAARAYAQLAELRPACSYTRNNWAVALAFEGRQVEAIETLTDTRESLPASMAEDRSVPTANLANLLVQNGQWDRAGDLYDEALAFDPWFEDAACHAALLALGRDQVDDAQAYLQPFLDDEQPAPFALGVASRIALRRGELELAVSLATRARQFVISEPHACATLAWSHWHRGALQDAVQAASEIPLVEVTWPWLAHRLAGWRHALHTAPLSGPGTAPLREAWDAYDRRQLAEALVLFDQACKPPANPLSDDLGAMLAAASCAAHLATQTTTDATSLRQRARTALERTTDALRALSAAGELPAHETFRILQEELLAHADLASVREPAWLQRLPETEREEWSVWWDAVREWSRDLERQEVLRHQTLGGQLMATVFGL